MSFSVSKNYLLLLLSPSAALGELADHSSPLFYELEIRLRRRISCQKNQPRPLSVASKKLTRVELSNKPTNACFFSSNATKLKSFFCCCSLLVADKKMARILGPPPSIFWRLPIFLRSLLALVVNMRTTQALRTTLLHAEQLAACQVGSVSKQWWESI